MFIGSFRRSYYSQFGEDVVLRSLFKSTQNGVFVDVGAYHPMHYSNTFLLYKRGWRGMNIEPNPVGVFLFNLHRPQDININSGIAPTVTEKSYYVFNHQSCNTFSEAQKEEVLKRPFIQFISTKHIPCRPLQGIIDEYMPGKRIDLLNVDVEGQNFEVLKTLDWQKNRPRVVCIEDDSFSFEKGSEIHVLLTSHDYALHSRVGLSSIYV